MKCPRCQHANSLKARFCEACGTSLARPMAGGQPTASDADLERLLKEALQQQTATSEILRVISGSPTGLQEVFDTIARNVVRLCNGVHAGVFRFDGELIHLVAHHNFTPQALVEFERAYPMRPNRESLSARAILDRAVVHVPDVESDPDAAASHRLGRATGYRSVLSVPMLRDGLVIGGISVGRAEKGPFSDRHIDLVRTFADQAVIAIENVRLFNEAEGRNCDLTEALEQQTATSEILRVISSSPTDTQPVFDTIAANAARLCAARDAQVLRVDGDVLRLVSAYGSPSMAPMRSISRGHAVGRAVIDRQTVHVRDMAKAVIEFPETSAPQHGVESLLAVPLLRNDVAVGVIRISRTQIQPFTDAQIALLQTFADQAVIAIENVRLFTELQEKNKALTQAHAQVTEALDQQTATSEILKVIARSPTDTQPVFDAIVENAARLCAVGDGYIILVEDGVLRAVSVIGQLVAQAPVYNARRVPLSRESVAGRAIVDRATIHIADLAAVSEDEFPEVGALQRLFGHHTMLATPLLREGAAIGVIVLFRFEVRPFSERQMELLKTFADQA
ncbi:MAG TPA: GAF domain-containing protein, partial [Gemmatimonadales bacterium]|nr:GAF domain-containing protein [Gemmatimonadales bacterium]